MVPRVVHRSKCFLCNLNPGAVRRRNKKEGGRGGTRPNTAGLCACRGTACRCARRHVGTSARCFGKQHNHAMAPHLSRVCHSCTPPPTSTNRLHTYHPVSGPQFFGKTMKKFNVSTFEIVRLSQVSINRTSVQYGSSSTFTACLYEMGESMSVRRGVPA